jgi:hypothetical protein
MSFKKAKASEEPKQKPVHKERVGLVTVSVWERKTDSGTFYNVTHERRYKDGENWKSTQSYDAGDIPNLCKALDRAHSAILDARAAQAKVPDSE